MRAIGWIHRGGRVPVSVDQAWIDQVLPLVGGADAAALDRTAAALRDLLFAVERLQKAGQGQFQDNLQVREQCSVERYGGPRAPDTRLPVDTLTPREREVLRLVVTGLPNRLVARRLEIAERTVKTHLHSIYRKLGVSGRTEATALILRQEVQKARAS
nr:response regulator transcription factor [Streptomyces sp. SID7805]